MGRILWAIVCVVAGIVISSSGVLGDSEASGQIGTIIMVIFLVIGLVPLLLRILELACMALSVTNKRVVGKTGVLRVHSLDLHIDKVDNVTLNATLLGRIFKYYNVTIKGSGDGTGVKFSGISNGPQIKNAITEAIEQHAAEARRAQAAEIAMAMRGKNN